MRPDEVISATPIQVEKTVRAEEIRALTSCRAGKVVPVSFVPVLREDRVSRGSVRISLQMAETVHPLMNSINVTAFAHFVPFSAFERFTGMDSFNRSYQGEGEPHNNTPIPFFKTVNFDRNSPFWKTLGVHWKQGQPINDAALHAYNLLVNWRRKARSDKLPQRGTLDTDLAACFWKHTAMAHIVPDFDQAAMDGEVELGLTNGYAPVRGIGYVPSGGEPAVQSRTDFRDNARAGRDMTNPARTSARLIRTESGATYSHNSNADIALELHEVGAGGGLLPAIYAELHSAGLKLTLGDIEVAKKTAAFARMREQYQGLDDDHLIDLLMEGIRVPDEALKQPILLDRKSAIFGYSERHAMDGENLDKSVTTGATEVTLNFRTPPMNTGGIVLVTLEIVPEQMFERQFDTFLGTTDPATLPNFLRDFLDPEKVEVVPNKFVDVEHATPNATFGYAPLNHAWKRSITRIGGKYYRPNPDTFVEDRQRFWSVEQLNPTLTADFYLASNLPHTVFADTLADPFEVLSMGRVEFVGNTVFGRALEEDDGHYEAVANVVDHQRIVQSPA